MCFYLAAGWLFRFFLDGGWWFGGYGFCFFEREGILVGVGFLVACL